jgi:hypothetical protein
MDNDQVDDEGTGSEILKTKDEEYKPIRKKFFDPSRTTATDNPLSRPYIPSERKTFPMVLKVPVYKRAEPEDSCSCIST